MVLPFKWNLFSSTFTWYYLFSLKSNFWVCTWNPIWSSLIQMQRLGWLFPHERALSFFKALNKLDKITMISALALSCRLFEIYGFVEEKNWLGLKSNWQDLSMLRFSCIVPDRIYGHLKVSAVTSSISPYVLSPTPLSLAACWHVLSSRLARPLKWRACLPANFWTLPRTS